MVRSHVGAQIGEITYVILCFDVPISSGLLKYHSDFIGSKSSSIVKSILNFLSVESSFSLFPFDSSQVEPSQWLVFGTICISYLPRKRELIFITAVVVK